MASWKKVLVSGSAGEFTSVTASVGLRVGNNQVISTTSATLTGSLFGTASWANNVVTASYVTGSIFTGTNLALSASYAETASYALNAGGGTLNISASDGTNTSISLSSEALIVSGTANEIEVTANAANNLLQIGLPNNVTIAGTLTVNGTVTTVSSSNLIVSDKFILLSSGSTNNNDGGIIVQNAASNNTGSGYGLFLEGQGFTGAVGSPAPRWGVTSSISQFAQNAATPDEYMVTAKTVTSPQTPGSTAPTYGGASSVGNGNMVIDSNGDIWIYVY